MIRSLIRLMVFAIALAAWWPAAVPAQGLPLRPPAPADGDSAARSRPPLAAPQQQAEAPGLWSRFLLDVRREQLRLQRALAGSIRAFGETSAMMPALVIAGLAFLYGVLHAVGPGHGKAVISSYLVATRARLRRGVLLAVMSSIVQAVTAVALVLVLVILFDFSNMAATARVRWLEVASYGLIVLLGVAMLFTALRRLFGGAAHGCAHDHAHGHAHDVPQAGGVGRIAALALVIGIRPCSGAVIVLLFALAQGAFLVGVGAAFAMAAGTAATVTAIAVLTVAARSAATRIAGSNDVWEHRIHTGLAIAGSAAVALFGGVLLAAALSGEGPG